MLLRVRTVITCHETRRAAPALDPAARSAPRAPSLRPLQPEHGEGVRLLGPVLHPLSQASAPEGDGRTRGRSLSILARDRASAFGVGAQAGACGAPLSLQASPRVRSAVDAGDRPPSILASPPGRAEPRRSRPASGSDRGRSATHLPPLVWNGHAQDGVPP